VRPSHELALNLDRFLTERRVDIDATDSAERSPAGTHEYVQSDSE